MWAIHHRGQFEDLDALQEPPLAGRRLDVGGFVFADPFDTFLKKISVEYLQEAWSQVEPIIKCYNIDPPDLSWGWCHPGETGIPGITVFEPHQWLGWTSQLLYRFYEEDRFSLADKELNALTPNLRCVATWRSHKWRIAPTNFTLALRLIEAMCTDEPSEWHPPFILAENQKINNPWLNLARAVLNEDQPQLDIAVEEAKEVYSPAGYRIVILQVTASILYSPNLRHLKLPSV